jgi:hypothetical protein
MAGPVEQAVRATVAPGERLRTPSQGAPFTVRSVDRRGVVLLLGKQETATPISWPILEGVTEFLIGRGWVPIGSVFDTQADDRTLDGYLKRHIKRATAGWVAALLERAKVVQIDREQPSKVRLASGFDRTPRMVSRVDEPPRRAACTGNRGSRAGLRNSRRSSRNVAAGDSTRGRAQFGAFDPGRNAALAPDHRAGVAR